MRCIVLDTNCLLQTLPARSPYHKIWTDILCGKISLCVNTEILNEYEEIITRYSSPQVAKNVVDAIAHSPHTLYKESFFKFRLFTQDPDDNKFVDCALASNAEYIVSEDSHFKCLEQIPFPKLTVIDLDQFLKDLIHLSCQ